MLIGHAPAATAIAEVRTNRTDRPKLLERFGQLVASVHLPLPVENGPVLRAAICGEDQVIYAGTVYLDCSVEKGTVTYVNQSKTRVRDDSTAAQRLAAQLKPGAPFKTHLVKFHDRPYILHADCK